MRKAAKDYRRIVLVQIKIGTDTVLVLNPQEKVDSTREAGGWQLVAGRLKLKEEVFSGAKRKALEEAGLRISESQLRIRKEFRSDTYYANRHFFFLEAVLPEDAIIPQESPRGYRIRREPTADLHRILDWKDLDLVSEEKYV